MRNIRFNLIVLLLFRLCLAGLQAQETIPVAGGDASGNEGSASYTVGQIVFTTITGIDHKAIQGVQQPYLIAITKGPENAEKFGIKCFVYPNPVKDQLILRIQNNNMIPMMNLSYRLYSMDGTFLLQGRITDFESIISMNHLAKSAYVLQVFNSQIVLVEFTIIKN